MFGAFDSSGSKFSHYDYHWMLTSGIANTVPQNSRSQVLFFLFLLVVCCSYSTVNALRFQGRFKAISGELTSRGHSFTLKWPRGNCESIIA